MHKSFILLAGIIALAATPSQSITTTNNFTGGDAGEGLELSDTYVYLVDLGGAAATRNIQGYTFTTAASAGLTVGQTGTPHSGNWGTAPEYGATASDTDLEAMMHNTRLSYGTAPSISVDAPVTSGREYELTLLFSDNAAGNRYLDVSVEGALISDDFSPSVDWSSGSNPHTGRALKHEFTAGDDTLSVLLTAGGTWDPNPVLQGFMLKDLGAPTVVVTTFTGGDAGEGLDLSGNMVYMVDLGTGTATRTIQGHTFSASGSTPGVAVGLTGSGGGNNWGTLPVYGDTASDNDLELLMHNGMLAYGEGAAIDIDMDVEQGRDYTLSLLFGGNYYDGSSTRRRCNVAVEGYSLATDFDLLQGSSWSGSPSNGVVMTVALTTPDDALNVEISKGITYDNNPLIQGFFLSVEPQGTLISIR
jgi:hypothetical protein